MKWTYVIDTGKVQKLLLRHKGAIAALATNLGVSRGAIYGWLADGREIRIYARTIRRIAERLDCEYGKVVKMLCRDGGR